jgi:hypothetical protein
MGAQQRLRLEVANLDAVLEHAHEHPAADGRRASGVAAVLDTHARVVADSALRLGEVLPTHQRQRLQVGLLFFEHGLHLPVLAALDARGGPLRLPGLEEGVLCSSMDLKRRTFTAVVWVWRIAFYTASLVAGVAPARRVGHDAVARERGGVGGVEPRQYGSSLSTPPEVVQHDLAAAAAEVVPGLVV